MSKSMGETITALRKAKQMTQKDLADRLFLTDKAVSKWERNAAFPDIHTLPKLAEVLGVSVDDLMQGETTPVPPMPSNGSALLSLVLKAVSAAMGVAAATVALLGALDMRSGFVMLGVGLACSGIDRLTGQLQKK